METLVINISEKKSALVKQLLKELGVTINGEVEVKAGKNKTPNTVTAKVIENAHKGLGLGKPIKSVDEFVKSL